MYNYAINIMALVFKFVLAMKDEQMVSLFKMLEASGLKKFLGCGEQIS